jgi:hypothetical protein
LLLNVDTYSDVRLYSTDINLSTPRKIENPDISIQNIRDFDKYTIHCWHFLFEDLYCLSSVLYSNPPMVSYSLAQKRRVRITLDLEVMSDFNPRDIDFEKLFKLEPNESVDVYVEDFESDW